VRGPPTTDDREVDALPRKGAASASPAVVTALRELESLGRFTADEIVKAARNEDSPLHEYFEWDDGKAAHAHRLYQARGLIRRLWIVVTVHTVEHKVPHYVRDQKCAKHEQGYVSHEQLRSEPANALALIRYEFTRAIECLTRAAKLAITLDVRHAELLKIAERVAEIAEQVEAQAKRKGK